MELRLAIAIALATPLAGIILEWLGSVLRMRGYSNIRAEVLAIAKFLRGQVRRSNGDITIKGRMESLPVTVTLSNSDSRPAVHIQVPVAGNLSLFCLPKGSDSSAPALEVSDPYLTERFCLSSNQPQLAKIIFLTPAITAELRLLCRSSGTFLALKDGQLEFSELFLGDENVHERVLNSLQAIAMISAASSQVPGAKPHGMRPAAARNWFRMAYVTAPILLVAVAFGITRPSHADPAPVSTTPVGIEEVEASKIPDIQLWRIGASNDFDPDAAAWLQTREYQPTGTIQGSFAGPSQHDAAYVLHSLPNSGMQGSRLVVFMNGEVRYDVTLPELALAARIPKDNLSSIEWIGRPPVSKPDGDGLLLVRRFQDPSTAMVLYASGVQIITARPKNFQAIQLR